MEVWYFYEWFTYTTSNSDDDELPRMVIHEQTTTVPVRFLGDTKIPWYFITCCVLHMWLVPMYWLLGFGFWHGFWLWIAHSLLTCLSDGMFACQLGWLSYEMSVFEKVCNRRIKIPPPDHPQYTEIKRQVQRLHRQRTELRRCVNEKKMLKALWEYPITLLAEYTLIDGSIKKLDNELKTERERPQTTRRMESIRQVETALHGFKKTRATLYTWPCVLYSVLPVRVIVLGLAWIVRLAYVWYFDDRELVAVNNADSFEFVKRYVESTGGL